jgi:hypothetical protein
MVVTSQNKKFDTLTAKTTFFQKKKRMGHGCCLHALQLKIVHPGYYRWQGPSSAPSAVHVQVMPFKPVNLIISSRMKTFRTKS